MTTLDLQYLDGKNVLVTSTADSHNPPAGMRGTIRIVPLSDHSGDAKAEISLIYPDMFNRPAHETIIPLNREDVDRLLASEYRGAFQLTVPYLLEETS